MDWRGVAGVSAGVGNLAATVPYIVATAKGSIRPSPVSWGGATVTSGIVFAAQMAAEPSWSALLPGSAVLYCAVIVMFTIHKVRPAWTTLDSICVALGVLAIVGWQLSGIPQVALVLSIVADALFFLPTIMKTRRHPKSEIPAPFVVKAAMAGLAALAARHLDLLSLGWPVYLATMNLGIASLARSHRDRSRTLVHDAPAC